MLLGFRVSGGGAYLVTIGVRCFSFGLRFRYSVLGLRFRGSGLVFLLMD